MIDLLFSGECSFETSNWNDGSNGMCKWTQSSSDDFDWTIGSGNTPSVRTGPKADHTLNTSSGKQKYFFLFFILRKKHTA